MEKETEVKVKGKFSKECIIKLTQGVAGWVCRLLCLLYEFPTQDDHVDGCQPAYFIHFIVLFLVIFCFLVMTEGISLY